MDLQRKKIYWIIGASIIVILIMLIFLIKNNKFELKGEISKCTSGEETVFQYITDLASYTTIYYKESGERVACELNSTSGFCEEFFSSISDCGLIYRNFADDKTGQKVYTEEAKEPAEFILKDRS